MKEYINRSNSKIITYALIAAAANLLGGLLGGDGSLIYIIIAALVTVFIILINRQEKYTIDEAKIERKKLSKYYIYWDDTKKVLISDWYIKITSGIGNGYKILKKKNQEEVFDGIKQDIISKCKGNKIEYEEPDSKEGLKREGGLMALYVYTVVNVVLYPIVLILYGYLLFILLESLLLSVLIIITLILSVIAAIFSVKALIGFNRRDKKAIKPIKNCQWFILAVQAMAGITNGIIQILTGNSTLMAEIFKAVGTAGYFVFMALVIIEYLKTSERIKHYFINQI